MSNINNVIVFLIVALVTFLIVQGINRLCLASQEGDQTKDEKPTTKTSPIPGDQSDKGDPLTAMYFPVRAKTGG